MSRDLHIILLERALGLLSSETRWCRGAVARTRNGRKCAPYAPEATRFCAFGALWRSAYQLTGRADTSLALAATVERQLGFGTGAQPRLSVLNDRAGHAETTNTMARRAALNR